MDNLLYDDVAERFLLKKYEAEYGEHGQLVLHYRNLIGHNKPLPWDRAFSNMKGRCGNPKSNGYKYYGGRGIKVNMTAKDLFKAFIRDDGYSLEKPSIDRIDPDGDYTVKNTRWIELSENRGRARRGLDGAPVVRKTNSVHKNSGSKLAEMSCSGDDGQQATGIKLISHNARTQFGQADGERVRN